LASVASGAIISCFERLHVGEKDWEGNGKGMRRDREAAGKGLGRDWEGIEKGLEGAGGIC